VRVAPAGTARAAQLGLLSSRQQARLALHLAPRLEQRVRPRRAMLSREHFNIASAAADACSADVPTGTAVKDGGVDAVPAAAADSGGGPAWVLANFSSAWSCLGCLALAWAQATGAVAGGFLRALLATFLAGSVLAAGTLAMTVSSFGRPVAICHYKVTLSWFVIRDLGRKRVPTQSTTCLPSHARICPVCQSIGTAQWWPPDYIQVYAVTILPRRDQLSPCSPCFAVSFQFC